MIKIINYEIIKLFHGYFNIKLLNHQKLLIVKLKNISFLVKIKKQIK
jgi:hypothetical protein